MVRRRPPYPVPLVKEIDYRAIMRQAQFLRPRVGCIEPLAQGRIVGQRGVITHDMPPDEVHVVAVFAGLQNRPLLVSEFHCR